MKRIIMILVFALVGAVVYWLRAEYNITTSRYANVNDAKDYRFWLGVLSAVGGSWWAYRCSSYQVKKVKRT